MKKILYASVLAFMMFAGCKKESKWLEKSNAINTVTSDYLSVVQQWLRQHNAVINDDAIDFRHYCVSKQKTNWFLRIAIKGKHFPANFILLATDSTGHPSAGRCIELEKGSDDTTLYNGFITIQSLDGRTAIHSKITAGYIESFHPSLFGITTKTSGPQTAYKQESFPVPIPYDDLPEFVVVGITKSGGQGISMTDYMNLQSLFGSGGGGGGGSTGEGAAGNYAGVYSYAGGGSSYADSPNDYNGYTDPNSTATPPDITLNFDDSYYRPAINLDAWFKCFTAVADAGASYSITLCADLPVDDDPSVNVNLLSGATGHCFLALTKSNSSQSVTQVIGFTAQKPFNAILDVDKFFHSKMVDNAGHKYDASLTMYPSAGDFNTVLEQMKKYAELPYSISRFDCLDYDLAVLNSIRTEPLVLPPDLANNTFSRISTGERMYSYLERLKWAGALDAASIIIGGPLWAGKSHGPCD